MADDGLDPIDTKLFDAAKKGDLGTLKSLLEKHPDRLTARDKPYEHSLLHAAAQHGQRDVVDYLIERGADVNYREKGDNTYAMHWAAAAGRVDIVKRLADAGGDVVGHGDDHAMEVIGWASMWDGAQDAAHREVVDFLLSRGAKHHIFSAIAMDLPDEVRRIVQENPKALEQRQSHNEDFQPALHYAVHMNRPEMVKLLLELGADPLATNHHGYIAAIGAMTPGIDRPIMEAIRARGAPNLLALVALGDWQTAERLSRDQPGVMKRGGSAHGVLHMMAKRGDAPAVKWLLEHGADAKETWSHYEAEVTALHMAAWGGHADVARLLLAAGADPTIKDSTHDSDALGWAEFFGRVDVVRLLSGKER